MYISLVGVVCFIVAILGIDFLSPDSFLIETGVFVTLMIGVVLIFKGLFKKWKPVVLISVWIGALLILRRLDWLNWITLAITLVVIGLATLIDE
jgi:Na+-transporting methylmalonyl-CoA/oxaloacetate decarboxylase beta subunit